MLKRILFAVAPLMLIAGTVVADDDLLSSIATLEGDTTAAAAVEDSDPLGQADVDALMGDGDESDEEAIAACFRRWGGYYGYRHFYRPFYRSYYRPFYHSYNYCYPTYYTYSHYTPVYRAYWGCW